MCCNKSFEDKQGAGMQRVQHPPRVSAMLEVNTNTAREAGSKEIPNLGKSKS